MVITGEGKIDSQSFNGKVISGVVKRTSNAGVPTIAVVGGIENGAEEFLKKGLNGIFSINRLPVPLSESAAFSENNLYLTVLNIMNLIKALENKR